MARLREYKGDTKCNCGKDLPVYLTAGGMLTSSCGWCRQQVHCPVGSFSFRTLEQSLKNGVDPEKENSAPPGAPKKFTPAAAFKVELKKPIAADPAAESKPAADTKPAAEKTIFDIFKG